MSVIAILWTFIYNPNPTQGLLNAILTKFGLPACDFLRSADTAMNSIIFMSGWHAAGHQMMILGRSSGNPGRSYEAASIDGAGALKKKVSLYHYSRYQKCADLRSYDDDDCCHEAVYTALHHD